MTMLSPSTEEPYLIAMISTTNRNGIESSTSTMRIRNPSTSPPASPDTAPQTAPTTIPISAEKKPISSAAWPPTMSSLSSSKPWLSVPTGWPGPGGRLVDSRLELSVPW